MITFTNSFHGTEYHSNKDVGERLSRSTVRRIERTLCGIDDCWCGQDPASTRASRYIVTKLGEGDYRVFLSGYVS